MEAVESRLPEQTGLADGPPDDLPDAPNETRAPAAGAPETRQPAWRPTLRLPAAEAGGAGDPNSAGSAASGPLLPPAHPRENPQVLAGLVRARRQADPGSEEQWTRFCQALWRADPAPRGESAPLEPRHLAPPTVRRYLDLVGLSRSQLIYRVKDALAAPGARDVWDRYTARHRIPGKGRAHPTDVPCPDMLAFLVALSTEER